MTLFVDKTDFGPPVFFFFLSFASSNFYNQIEFVVDA